MLGQLERAIEFATLKHEGQVRKFTGEPYILHPIEVSHILRRHGLSLTVQVAGVLHDVHEDCDVSLEEIASEFDNDVARLVREVSNVSRPEDGNRATRKAIDLEHLKNASPDGQSLKCADIMSNTTNIALKDAAFARMYLPEKMRVLSVLGEADLQLLSVTTAMVQQQSAFLINSDRDRLARKLSKSGTAAF